MKTCSGCKKLKDLSAFYVDKHKPSGLTSKCKSCLQSEKRTEVKKRGCWDTDKQRDSRFKRVFGISLDEYNTLLEEQEYKCAICGKSEEENKKRLAVDHCHKTNKVRKLLCHHCNCALGMVNDDEEILVSMLSYLKEFR